MMQGGTNTDDTLTEVDTSNVYHKLAILCTEIEDGIRLTTGPSLTVQNDILRIRSEAFKESCPEASYALRLFRRYASEANAVKLSAAISSHSNTALDTEDNLNIVSEVPLFLYEGTRNQLIGEKALGKNIFWFRAATTLFSLICFSVMASVPHLHDRIISAKRLFNVKYLLLFNPILIFYFFNRVIVYIIMIQPFMKDDSLTFGITMF